MKAFGLIQLYRHCAKPTWIIVRFRRTSELDSGFHGWGDLVSVSAGEAEARLLDIVLGELADARQIVLPNSPELSASPAVRKRQARILREFEPVSISDPTRGELQIQPLLMSPRGGGMGDPKDRVIFSLPNTNQRFLAALDVAYSRCAVVYDR
jgi:hypothetical protein